jgi:hypothetical protein
MQQKTEGAHPGLIFFWRNGKETDAINGSQLIIWFNKTCHDVSSPIGSLSVKFKNEQANWRWKPYLG